MNNRKDQTSITSEYLHQIKEKQKKKKVSVIICSALAAIVATTTIAEMIQPAAAVAVKENMLDCHFDVHEHTDECYEPVYDEEGNEIGKELICGQADYVVHQHTAECYKTIYHEDEQYEETVLVCTLSETEKHEHDESCYEERQVLVCEEDHEHDESCYETEKVLICDKLELHTHTDECYEIIYDEAGNAVDKKLICGKIELLEHQHDENCFTEVEVAADEEEAETAVEEAVSADMPAQNFHGETAELTVDVTAPEGAFPKDTTMSVHLVEDEDVLNAAAGAAEDTATQVTKVQAVDITFKDAEGKEIQPLQPIQVIMTPVDRKPEENETASVYHVDDKKEATSVELKDDINTKDEAVAFDADAFSVYALVYTVDFEYSVNGKKFQFNLSGGGFVSFTDLVEVLGILDDTNFRDAADFVAQVEQVEFSSPELLSVSKVEEITTVGEIKNGLGLECEYSAELTEDQIMEINAQTLRIGDWALISIQPFTSEETLTVTMKNGEVFTINVTDSQDPYGLDGQSFEMVVNGNKALSPVSETENIGGINYQFLNNADPQSGSNLAWQFEYDHEAFGGNGSGYYISHDGQYLKIVGDDSSDPNRTVTLVNSKEEATPIAVKYDQAKGKYSFSNKADSSNGFLRQFNTDYFGVDGNSNDDNAWFELRDPDHPEKPGLISPWDVKGDNIRIKLFDYSGTINDENIDKSWGDRYSANDWHNSTGINNGRTLIFSGGGLAANSDGQWNYYTGSNPAVMQGIVKNTLVNGYPELTNTTGNKGASLGYLFGAGGQEGVTAYAGSDGNGLKGLLRRDENGYYYFSSEQNYASLVDPETGQIVNDEIYIYSESYKKDNPSVNSQKIGFFPFDPYREGESKAGEEKGFSGSPYNHQFGMSLEADFVLPPEGKLPNGEDMVFSFSGDDDVWVFIDDVLVLDLGGVHQPLSGNINFAEGKSYVTDATIQTVTGQTNTVGNGRTIAELFAAAGKTYDDSPYSTHTIKFFYLERGGCDSNCTLSFNLDVVKGKGSVDIAKYDKDSQPVAPLKGVKFGVYTNPECTDLLKEFTSDGNGIVAFKDLPVKTDDQKYYLKETKELAGYEKDETVYTLVAVKQEVGKYSFQVTKDDQEIETIGQNPKYPVIYNEQIDPINLSVEKKWEDTNGNTISPPLDASATFKVQRYVKTEGDIERPDPTQPVTLKVYRYKDGQNPVQVGSDYTNLKGGSTFKVNWSYSGGYLNYDYENRYNTYKYNSTSGNYSVKNGNGPLELTLPESGTANLYIRDDNIGTQWGAGVINVTVTDTTPYEQSTITEHVSTEWEADGTYNGASDCPALTLPESDDNPWVGQFSNLKTAETKADGLSYFYKYYIIETNKTPQSSQTVYVDGDGKVIQDVTSLQTDEDGKIQKIINKVPIGYLKIEKKVTYNNSDQNLSAEQKSKLAGDYKFKIYTNEQCGEGDAVQDPNAATDATDKDLIITITIGNDGQAVSSDAIQLLAGDYWIKEVESSNPAMFPVDNPIKATVTTDKTTSSPVISTLTNNYDENNGPDKIAIDIEKKFQGLDASSQVPANFQVLLQYTVGGQIKTVTLQNKMATGENNEKIAWTESTDGFTWHWKVTNIPSEAINFRIKEENYDKAKGYDWKSATLNGTTITSTVTEYHDLTVTAPAATLSDVTNDRRTSDSGQNTEFYLEEDDILLTKLTANQGTLVISLHPLNLAEKDAVEKGWPSQGGFKKPPHYFSIEEHPNGFAYGNKTVTFGEKDGKTTVKFTQNASAQETVFAVTYSSQDARNNANLVNVYEEIPITIDIIKVDKNNKEIKLPGAVFTIRQLADEEPTESGGTIPSLPNTQSKDSDKTDKNGKTSFGNLTHGYYEIKEKTAPEGYVFAGDVTFYFKIESGEVTWLEKGDGKPSTWDVKTPSDGDMVSFEAAKAASGDQPATNDTFTVKNEPGAELPYTGGPGAHLYMIFGSILLLSAGILLIQKHRMTTE